MPKRIQRKRTKGWKMPEGAVYVGRPSEFKNPFKVGGYFMMGRGSNAPGFSWCESFVGSYGGQFTLIETNAMAVEWYREYSKRYPMKNIANLRGKDLACWCALDKPCHADVLLEIANA